MTITRRRTQDAPTALAPIGLRAREEQVYRLLLGRRDAAPAQLAAELGISTHQIDTILNRLWGLGLASRMSGHRRRFTAADPDAALEALVRSRMTELEDVRTTALALSSVFHSVQRHNTSGGTIELLDGPEELGRWFLRLQHQARTEMMALDRPPYALDTTNPMESPSLSQGVQWRTIYAPESLEMPGTLQEVEALVSQGEYARVLPNMPLKLAIADRRVALLPLSLDIDNTRSALVRESTLLDALVSLFEFYWDRAVPIGSTERVAQLDDEERSVLQLLASGLTDNAIARQLGLSTRTMRRRTRSLFDKLAADNRFQAGVQASRNGWL